MPAHATQPLQKGAAQWLDRKLCPTTNALFDLTIRLPPQRDFPAGVLICLSHAHAFYAHVHETQYMLIPCSVDFGGPGVQAGSPLWCEWSAMYGCIFSSQWQPDLVSTLLFWPQLPRSFLLFSALLSLLRFFTSICSSGIIDAVALKALCRVALPLSQAAYGTCVPFTVDTLVISWQSAKATHVTVLCDHQLTFFAFQAAGANGTWRTAWQRC